MKLKQPLSSPRIVLRNYEKADLPFSVGMWLDAENGKYLSDPTPAFVDAAYQKALEELQDSQEGYYLIAQERNTGARLGTCCLFPDESRKVYDIGYCIHKNFWKQGYGTEMLGLIIQWVKDQGGTAITGEVAVENAASNALLRKLGFQVAQETQFRKYHMEVIFPSYLYRLELCEQAIPPV